MTSEAYGIAETTPLARQVSSSWRIGSQACSRSLIVYSVQITFLFIALIASLTNLIIGKGDSLYWSSLLTFTLTAILPNAKVKRSKPPPVRT